jgi:hypothetical protein
MTVSGFINTQNALFNHDVVWASIFNTPALELSDLDEACLHIGIWNEWINEPKGTV